MLHLDFLSVNPAMPMSVTANAIVTDVNRQTWSASAALIVHPSSLYVGLKTKKPFVEKGTPFDLDVIGVDLDGKAALGAKIEVKAVRLDWEYKKGKYTQKEVDPQTCAVVAANDPVPCTFATKDGGTYQVTATIVDDKGRPNQTKLTFWVSGGDQPPAREVAQERVQLIPDKKEYAAGDTAELLRAGAVLSGRGRRHVAAQRHRQDRAHHADRADDDDQGADHRRDGAEPVRAGRSRRHGRAHSTTRAIRIRSCRSGPRTRSGTINLPVPPKQRTLAVDGRAERRRSSRPARRRSSRSTCKDARGPAGRRTPRPR